VKIKLIAVGRIKDKNISGLVSEYSKKISYDAKIETIEIKDATVEEEGRKIIEIIEKIKDNRFIFVLSEEGKQLSSIELSGKLKQLSLEDITIIFIIGGPFGLSEQAKKKADFLLSLSKMTFTHEMCRLFLLEQVYRELSIIRGKNYHK
jgi:23S rRNA (pseudouridine1915-N3)-methyltransferase